MREYETTFIVQPEISDEGCQELFARIDGILDREGAIRLLHDDQGKRKLAYEIRKFQKGRYVTTQYLDRGGAVAPFERTLRLEESVLRFLTVQVADRVEDVEHRKELAAEEERIRADRARERAEREAEEEKARREAAKLAGEAALAEAKREAELSGDKGDKSEPEAELSGDKGDESKPEAELSGDKGDESKDKDEPEVEDLPVKNGEER